MVQDIFSIIREINRQGVTVLLVEQNANMALKIADLAYVLETGTITMSAYSSLIGEFGLIGFIALAAVIIRYVREQRPWNRMIVCWLILTAYLYVQFEGYAFYALPLFIWTIGNRDIRCAVPLTRSEESGDGDILQAIRRFTITSTGWLQRRRKG